MDVPIEHVEQFIGRLVIENLALKAALAAKEQAHVQTQMQETESSDQPTPGAESG